MHEPDLAPCASIFDIAAAIIRTSTLFVRSLAPFCGAAPAKPVPGLSQRLQPGRLFLILLLFIAPGVLAATQEASPPNFRQTVWSERDGARTGPSDLVQTTDGYLWFATSAGLNRFDSIKFEDVDIPGHPELRGTSVHSLFPTADGGLWAGYTLGGAVFLKDGKATLYGIKEGLPAGTVYGMAQETDGTLWAATSRGFARLEHGHWTDFTQTFALKDRVIKLFMDSDDTLWLIQPSGLSFKRKGLSRFEPVSGEAWDFSTSIAESPRGDIWVYSKGILIKLGHAKPSRLTRGNNGELAFSEDGSAWISATKGSAGRMTRIPASNLTQDRITVSGSGLHDAVLGLPIKRADRSMMDDEGNFWVGGGSGLERISLSNLRTVESIPSAWNTQRVIGAADDGGLWIANFRNFATRAPGDALLYRDHRFFTNANVPAALYCIVRTESGIWFGNHLSLREITNGKVIRFDVPSDMTPSGIQSMTSDGRGGLWVSIVRKGVYRFANGVWTLHPEMSVALILATDSAGALWMGYPDGRVARFDGSKLTWYSEKNGLDIGAVTALEVRRGHVWAGGSAGVARLSHERFQSLSFEAETLPRNVTGIVERRNGDLWLLAAGGAVHVPAAEIDAASADSGHLVLATVLGPKDGIIGAEWIRPVPALIEGTDGKLWATTTADVYMIDPDLLLLPRKAPRITLHGLVADGHAYLPTSPISLPSIASTLRIAYAGVSLTSGESVRYRYRLEGLDGEWQDVGARNEASFTNLPPGSYRFRLQARFVDGPWVSERLLSFTKAPTFMQTRVFLLLCGVALLGVVGMLVRLRIWQIRRRLNLQFEARSSERERIARDLHDTLLQSSQGLVLKVHAAARRLATDNPDRALLEAAVADADLALVEGRDRIVDLRKAGRTIHRLRTDLIAVGETLSRDGQAAFTHSVGDAVHELRPDIADEVFSVGREALLNAFRHAQARQVKLELADTRSGFAMSVIDDGSGLDDKALTRAATTGHWGLAGMRERAARIDGQIEFSSRPHGGTEIILTIPAATAYRRNGFWRQAT